MASASDELFLGVDCGTQSTKAVVLDGGGAAVTRASVAHDRDLGFATRDGVVRGPGGEVLAPIHMWVEALDSVLLKLGLRLLGRVTAISVSAQQHGSVYWTRRGLGQLGRLQGSLPPQDQLAGAFVEDLAPVWMDTSTGAECAEMAHKLGGDARVADVTGSAPYERFTGHQIAKRLKQARYRDACARVSLVSSFLPSLLLGRPAPVDVSDASGMNLLDIWSRQWWPAALEACADGVDLAALLGSPVPSHVGLGAPSAFAQHRYGFSHTALVAPGSGDNPCTLVGMGITQPRCVGVSLGTSDTVFALTDKPVPGIEGHVLCSPLPPQADAAQLYMAMLCCSNGSLTRDAVRRACLGESATWEDVDAAVAAAVAEDGTPTRVAACFLTPEITPRVSACGAVLGEYDTTAWRGAPVAAMAVGVEGVPAFLQRLLSAAEARGWEPRHVLAAVALGHALSLRAHAERLGVGACDRVVVAGGASASRALVQVIADVFCAPVHATTEGEAAAVGAALRARHALRCDRAGGAAAVSAEAGAGATQHRLVASPRPGWTKARADDLARFVLRLEQQCARLGAEDG